MNRDLKPDNLLIDLETKQVLICDHGLAKMRKEEDKRISSEDYEAH